MINDNQAPAILTRHLDIGFSSLLDWQEEGSTSMDHVARILNPSDDLTEPLAHCLHARHCLRMIHFASRSILAIEWRVSVDENIAVVLHCETNAITDTQRLHAHCTGVWNSCQQQHTTEMTSE